MSRFICKTSNYTTALLTEIAVNKLKKTRSDLTVTKHPDKQCRWFPSQLLHVRRYVCALRGIRNRELQPPVTSERRVNRRAIVVCKLNQMQVESPPFLPSIRVTTARARLLARLGRLVGL